MSITLSLERRDITLNKYIQIVIEPLVYHSYIRERLRKVLEDQTYTTEQRSFICESLLQSYWQQDFLESPE